MTILDLVEDSTQSVWNVCKIFTTVCYISRQMLLWMENSVERKTCKYRK